MSKLSKELIRQIIADGGFQTLKDIGDYLKDMFKDVIQEILNKAEKVLNVLNNKNNIDFDFFKVVCCNFKLLEMKSNEWKNINNKNL